MLNQSFQVIRLTIYSLYFVKAFQTAFRCDRNVEFKNLKRHSEMELESPAVSSWRQTFRLRQFAKASSREMQLEWGIVLAVLAVALQLTVVWGFD